MRHGEHMPLGIKLRPSRTAKHLLRRAGIDQLFLIARTFHQRRQHHRPRRQIQTRRECFGTDAHRQQLFLKQCFDHPPIARQQPRMMNPHAPRQKCPQPVTRTHRKIKRLQPVQQQFALPFGKHILALENLRRAPADLAIKTKHQRRCPALFIRAPRHPLDEIRQQFIADPMEMQRHLPLRPLHQRHTAIQTPRHPVHKLPRRPHRRR